MGIKSIFAALPIAGVIYSFIGFNPAVQLTAEVKDPKKAIPFAIIGSLLILGFLSKSTNRLSVAPFPLLRLALRPNIDFRLGQTLSITNCKLMLFLSAENTYFKVLAKYLASVPS